MNIPKDPKTIDAELVGTAKGILRTYKSTSDIRDALVILDGVYHTNNEPARQEAIKRMGWRRGQ